MLGKDLLHKVWQPWSSGFRGSTPRHKKKVWAPTPTTTVSAQRDIEKKRKDWKRKIYTDNSIVTRNISPKKALVTKARRVNDDALQPGGTLARRLNHDKPHWPKPVTGSGVACQLC